MLTYGRTGATGERVLRAPAWRRRKTCARHRAGLERLEPRRPLTVNLLGDFGRVLVLDAGVSTNGEHTGSVVAQCIAVDAAGNQYVAGRFSGSVDLDPGPATSLLSDASFSGNAFVAKYDGRGGLVWCRGLGGSGLDQVYDLAVDADGHVTVVGMFENAFDFVGNPVSSAGSQDAFVAQFDASGALAWVRTLGGIGRDSAEGVAVAPDGAILVCGDFEQTVDFDPGVMTASRSAMATGGAGYVLKLSRTGAYVWSAILDGTGAAALAGLNDVVVDSRGAVAAVGIFLGTIDVDPSAGSSTMSSAAGDDRNGFLVQLDANGAFAWARHFAGSSVIPTALAVDGEDNLAPAGYFIGAVNVAAGNPSATLQSGFSGTRTSAMVSKWSASGELRWTRRIGETADGNGGMYNGDVDVAVSPQGRVLIAGTFLGSMDFDPSGASAVRESQSGGGGLSDAYLARLDANGDFVSVDTFGGMDSDYGLAAATGPNGQEFLGGYFNGTLDFDPSADALTYSAERGHQYSALVRFGGDVAQGLRVLGVTPPAAGLYTVGARLRFGVTLSAEADVRGKPQLEILVGQSKRLATYVEGDGTRTLTFEYIVGKGDTGSSMAVGHKLVFARRSSIGVGTDKLPAQLPTDIAGTQAMGVQLDTRAPTVMGRVSPPQNATYTVGQPLDFVVRFSESVVVAGSPSIALTGLGAARRAVYAMGSGTDTVSFRYVVQAGDRIAGKRILGIGNTISVPVGSSITDEAGNRAALRVVVPPLRGIRIDAALAAASLQHASAQGARNRLYRLAAFAAGG